jgi:transposase
MLGIDVSKANLSCVLVDPKTEKVRWSSEVANSDAGVNTLLRQIPADVPWVVEPTGVYSQLVASRGLAAGRRVLMAQPKRAKLFLASIHTRQKTDALDGRGLALYGVRNPLPPFPQKTASVEHLDQLQAARRGLSRAISRLRLQEQSLPLAAEVLKAARRELERQRAELDKQLRELLDDRKRFPMAEEFRKVPGSVW